MGGRALGLLDPIGRLVCPSVQLRTASLPGWPRHSWSLSPAQEVLGRPVRPELYSDHFRDLCGVAGVRTIHLHLIRHTLAGVMNRKGVPPVDAAALLGHTVEVYYSTYLLKEDGVRSAAKGLGAALMGGVLNGS